VRKLIIFSAALALTAAIALPALAAGPGAAMRTPRTHSHWFAGTVTAVGTDSLSVGVLWTGPHDGTLNGQTLTLAVDAGTAIVSGPNHTSEPLASIQNGDLVGVMATGLGRDLSTLTATKVHVNCDCHWVGGTISAVGTSSLIVQVSRTGPYDTVLNGQSVTIGAGGSTIYIQGKGKTPITLSDLTVGEGVGIVFSANGFFRAPGFNAATATFTAARVHVWGQKDVPAPATDSTSAAPTGA
jgi:hypothetical protein